MPPVALERFLAHYDQRLTVHTRPYAGIPEALDALRQRKCALAVLTNKPQRPTQVILERLDLDRWFTDVVGGDTEAGRKPQPERPAADHRARGRAAGFDSPRRGLADRPSDRQSHRHAHLPCPIWIRLPIRRRVVPGG